jgi:RHS repeat-associated protein
MRPDNSRTITGFIPRLRSTYEFSGKERDAETGLDYFGARYYASELSVWLSVDPMSDKYPSHSPFNYTLNNPVMLIDPNGDSVLTNQEGYNIINEGLQATLGDDNPFGYDSDKKAITFDKDFDRSQYNEKQLEVIDRYGKLVCSKTNIVNVNIVDFNENISELGSSLEGMEGGFANGVTIPYTISDTETKERIGTISNVYIARNPKKKSGTDSFGDTKYRNEPSWFRGLVSIHEIAGHAYLRAFKPSVVNHNEKVESFENRVRKIYMYNGRAIKGYASPH